MELESGDKEGRWAFSTFHGVEPIANNVKGSSCKAEGLKDLSEAECKAHSDNLDKLESLPARLKISTTSSRWTGSRPTLNFPPGCATFMTECNPAADCTGRVPDGPYFMYNPAASKVEKVQATWENSRNLFSPVCASKGETSSYPVAYYEAALGWRVWCGNEAPPLSHSTCPESHPCAELNTKGSDP